MKLNGVDKVRLDWARRERDGADYDSGIGYELYAPIPFELEYVVSFDDDDYEAEMHEEYLLAEARGLDCVPLDAYQRIRKEHGEPSESLERWRVDLSCPDGSGGDFMFEIGCGLSLDRAKSVALESYKLRVAAAVAGFPLY